MSNVRVHVSQPTEVILNGNLIEIKTGSYNVTDTKFCKDNDFMQCSGCKDWFDEVSSLGIYHPQYDERKQKHYCEKCFNSKYK